MDAGLYDHVHAGLVEYACSDSSVVLWSLLPKVFFKFKDSKMVLNNQD